MKKWGIKNGNQNTGGYCVNFQFCFCEIGVLSGTLSCNSAAHCTSDKAKREAVLDFTHHPCGGNCGDFASGCFLLRRCGTGGKGLLGIRYGLWQMDFVAVVESAPRRHISNGYCSLAVADGVCNLRTVCTRFDPNFFGKLNVFSMELCGGYSAWLVAVFFGMYGLSL